MRVVQKIARGIIFPMITKLGLEKLLSVTATNNCLIIMYHGVIDDHTARINGRHISRSVFIRHLEYFNSNFDVIPLQQIFNYYRNGTSPKRKSIALTFDDGYINNYSVAAPILNEYSMPATFFVQGMSMVDSESITWPDVIDILFYCNEKSIRLGETIYNANSDKRGYYDADSGLSLTNAIKMLDPEQRTQFYDYLEVEFRYKDLVNKIDPNLWKLMSAREVSTLAQNRLFEIGSHSYSHLCLANINVKYIKAELQKSKEILEEVCQKQIVSLAFPDGSYDDNVKRISLETGYKNLCAVDYRLHNDIDDLTILQRHGLSATTTVSSNLIFLRKSFRSHGF